MSQTSGQFSASHAQRSGVARIDALCDRFEQSWHEGAPPRLEEYLEGLVVSQRSWLLKELLLIDLRWRKRRGETPNAAEYAARLPTDRAIIDDVFASVGPESRSDSCPDGAATPAGAHELSTRDFSQQESWQVAADEVAETIIAPRGTYEGDSSAPLSESSGEATGAAHSRRLGDYELLGEIARGGMGVVYKAMDRQLDRLVALKLIKSGELADADQIERFYFEAKAAAQLDHPGIVHVFEVGQFGNQHFMAMAFIDGQSLWQEVKESPLAPKRAAKLMQQVAEAVQYAHEHGIIHRDLKPQNILITQDGQPKVTDFGLAKRQTSDSSLTETGQALGTPSYMPPEQAQGKIKLIGPLADVYSLGATLYCLLTGRPPFQAATQLETMLQVVDQEPVSPKSLNRAVSIDLETICLRCLEKDPVKRYASAGALAEDLHRYLVGEPIQARPVGRLERTLKWIARKPMTAAAYGLTALAVCLLVVGVTIFVFWQNAELARGQAENSRGEAEQAKNEAVAARQKTESALQGETEARSREEEARNELQKTKDYDQYVLNVRLAPTMWDNGWVANARKSLNDCPPHLRQWEW